MSRRLAPLLLAFAVLTQVGPGAERALLPGLADCCADEPAPAHAADADDCRESGCACPCSTLRVAPLAPARSHVSVPAPLHAVAFPGVTRPVAQGEPRRVFHPPRG